MDIADCVGLIKITLESWDEFPSALDYLAERQAAKEAKGKAQFHEPLFRGLGDSEWLLETTLERSTDVFRTPTLLSYYRSIEQSKPEVESGTEQSWDQIPEWLSFNKLIQDTSKWINQILHNNSAIYSYLVYLRHHGFPSPLLDWTASPYIAAFFAFDVTHKQVKNAGIYVYVRNPYQGYSSNAHLFVIGPHMKTHPRHDVQQSRYSLCVQQESTQTGDQPHIDYRFLSHNNVLHQNMNDDLVAKIIVPVSERRRALIKLDSMDIDPYSLYGSEESFIRTIARRELLFK